MVRGAAGSIFTTIFLVKDWCAVFVRRLGHWRSTDQGSRFRFTPDEK